MTEMKKHGTEVLNPVPGVRDVFATILESVTAEVASSAKGTGLTAPLPAVVSEVVSDAVRGAVAMGSDLVPAAKAIVMGVVRGAAAKDDAALRILAHASRTIIHHTADRGGDLAAATKGLVLGGIASARTIGVDLAKAASIAAQGAVEGAREAGSVTVERVLGALKEPIGGIKVALPEPSAK